VSGKVDGLSGETDLRAMRSSIVSKAFLAVEAAVCLAAVLIAIGVASRPLIVPCGGCMDPHADDDPYRIAFRLGILVIGGVLASFLEFVRRGIGAHARNKAPA
jgi:hypothetical protein